MGWLIGNDPDAGKYWRQEEKGVAEDEMVGWHHQLNGQEFEQTPGDSEGPGSLACCSPWGCKESDTTKWLNNSNSSSRNSEKHFNVLTRLVICYKKNVTQKQTSERDAKGNCRGEVGWGGKWRSCMLSLGSLLQQSPCVCQARSSLNPVLQVFLEALDMIDYITSHWQLT